MLRNGRRFFGLVVVALWDAMRDGKWRSGRVLALRLGPHLLRVKESYSVSLYSRWLYECCGTDQRGRVLNLWEGRFRLVLLVLCEGGSRYKWHREGEESRELSERGDNLSDRIWAAEWALCRPGSVLIWLFDVMEKCHSAWTPVAKKEWKRGTKKRKSRLLIWRGGSWDNVLTGIVILASSVVTIDNTTQGHASRLEQEDKSFRVGRWHTSLDKLSPIITHPPWEIIDLTTSCGLNVLIAQVELYSHPAILLIRSSSPTQYLSDSPKAIRHFCSGVSGPSLLVNAIPANKSTLIVLPTVLWMPILPRNNVPLRQR